jgi:hypothetical protein
MVNGRDDPAITDAVLRAEIELLADLLTAARKVTGPMSDAQIDEALGLSGPDSAGSAPRGPHPEAGAS